MEQFNDFGPMAGFGARRPFVTWGVFDGVHLGHQAILGELVGWARAVGGTPTAITFADHPRHVLEPRTVPYIVTLMHRRALLERHGLAACLTLRFDETFSVTPAEEFFHRDLVGTLGVRGIVLGAGATFGRGREGTLLRLRQWGAVAGVEVREVVPIELPGGTISSSAIRQAIATGDLESAARMLGRPFTVMGPVVHGDHRGRALGFPTANLDLPGLLLPPAGVWACRVSIDGRVHDALTNIGVRPTFASAGAPAPVVETHVVDFAGDLYDRELEVEFRFLLREERKFSGAEALVAQIRRDREALLARRDG